MEISAEALALHKKAILIDGHNDSIIEHWARGDALDLTPNLPDYQVDLPRMRTGGLTAMNSMIGGQSLHQSIDLWDGMYEHVETYPEDYLIVYEPDDILRAKQERKIGLIGQLESCTCLGNSIRALHMMYRIGLRVGNLTHGEAKETSLHGTQSPFGYCTASDREAARRDFVGLTDFGREAIPEMNRLGIVVDTAHTQDASFFETLETTSAPVEFSHGAVFALCPHWRCLTDDQLRALKDNGGVIGIAFYGNFISENPDRRKIEGFVDHVEYVCDLIGDDHVGFGADLDGIGDAVGIPPSHAETSQITQVMLNRGFTEEMILKFWGGNFLRVMRIARDIAE